MASDYLISKWKMWFKCLDAKHEGKVAKADMDEAINKFVHLNHVEAEQRNVLMKQLEEWWDEYIFHHKPDPLSEQDFVDNLNRELKAGKESFRQRMVSCMKIIFDTLNISHDGNMSEQEFVTAFRAVGHENLKLDTDFFNAYNPVNGKVHVQKISDSWVHFATCEDPSLKDIVKEAFDAGF